MKSFEKWKFEEIQKTFGLRRASNMPLLAAWRSGEKPLSEKEYAVSQDFSATGEDIFRIGALLKIRKKDIDRHFQN